jgi:hypothetical protein
MTGRHGTATEPELDAPAARVLALLALRPLSVRLGVASKGGSMRRRCGQRLERRMWSICARPVKSRRASELCFRAGASGTVAPGRRAPLLSCHDTRSRWEMPTVWTASGVVTPATRSLW